MISSFSKFLSKKILSFGRESLQVRKDPVRYFVGDLACLGKAKDIRVMFYVKEYLHMDLTVKECGILQNLYDLNPSLS
jgi:hypothetical protein